MLSQLRHFGVVVAMPNQPDCVSQAARFGAGHREAAGYTLSALVTRSDLHEGKSQLAGR